MDLYDRKMVTNTNLKYADSSLNYYVIIMYKISKNFNSKISKEKSRFQGMKCQPKANNNRFVVVVCFNSALRASGMRFFFGILDFLI